MAVRWTMHIAVLAVCVAQILCDARELELGRKLQSHSSDDPFDYFMFVRQWPSTFCAAHGCPKLTHPDWYRFTIHGLWPNYADGTWPQFCDKSMPFDEELVADLEPELDDEWPSFMDSSTNQNFWAHEWNKHGTCSLAQLPDEHAFFKTVLKLHWKYDLKAAFASAGIRPSTTKTYPKQALLDAIQDSFGVNAMLHCTPDGRLTEVWMCVGKDLQAQDCSIPASEEQRCKEIRLQPLHGNPGPAAAAAAAAGASEAAGKGAGKVPDASGVQQQQQLSSRGVAGTHAHSRHPTPPPAGRAAIVSCSAVLLALLVLSTLVSSWGRRLAQQQQQQAIEAGWAGVTAAAAAGAAEGGWPAIEAGARPGPHPYRQGGASCFPLSGGGEGGAGRGEPTPWVTLLLEPGTPLTADSPQQQQQDPSAGGLGGWGSSWWGRAAGPAQHSQWEMSAGSQEVQGEAALSRPLLQQH
ncbi:ribonuclease T2-like protein [Haematococcus lacustris]